MDVAIWVEWVRWSARLATAAFVLAVALPPLSRGFAARSAGLWLVFLLAQSVHFGLVVRLAVLVDGVDMFPGGSSVADVGGWSTVLAIFSLFYAFGAPVLWRRRRGEAAGSGLRVASTIATLGVGLMLLATYVPLWNRSSWFVLPAVLVALALLAELAGPTLRRVRCVAA